MRVTATASGGAYSGKRASVTVTVRDVETGNLVVTPTTVVIDENGTGTFTLKLATPPTRTVVVTTRSDDTGAATVPTTALAFSPVNWETAQTVTVTGVRDGDAENEVVTVLVEARGGEYSGVSAVVTVEVSDAEGDNLVAAPATVTIDEDGRGTFTLKLATEPTGPVTVTLSSDNPAAAAVRTAALTFTTGDWNTAQTVIVAGVADADAENETVTVTALASGGGYGGKTASVVVEVTDDETANLLVAPATVTIDEDGTGTFTLRLAAEPTGPVTITLSSNDPGAVTVPAAALTFTAMDWETAPTVMVVGVADDDAANERVAVTASASNGGYSGKTAAVTVEVMDDETANLLVTPNSLTLVEHGSGRFEVRLATEPTGSVTVTLSSEDTAVATVFPSTLTFTASTWHTALTVTVRAVGDDDSANASVTVAARAAGGGYAGKTATVAVEITDDEAPNMLVAPSSLTIEEGRRGTFVVKLTTEPTATVTVALGASNARKAAVPLVPLTFTASTWSTWQTVAVTGVADDDAEDETETVTVTASGGDYEGKVVSLAVEVTDDDTANLVVAPSLVTIDEDGTGIFMVRLATEPTAPVTVTLSSDDTGAVTIPAATLTFTATNWDTTQAVTVAGVGDADAENETVAVKATASGGGYSGKTATVTVDVSDNEMPNLVVAPTQVAIDEGGTGTFTVKLATVPTGVVTVTLSSDDPGAVGAPVAGLTFTATNWDTARTVTVEGVVDTDAGDETVTVRAAASGGGYSGRTASVTVEVSDAEGPRLVVTPSTVTIAEGSTGTFTLKLGTLPTGPVTVTLGSDDPGAVGAPVAGLTFTVTNWDTVQTVTVTAGEDDDGKDEAVTVAATASGGDYAGESSSVTVEVADDDVVSLLSTPSTVVVREGGTGTFAMKLNTQPTAVVNVTLRSGDPEKATLSGGRLRFTTSTWNTWRTVTVRGVEDEDAENETVTVAAAASGGDYEGETTAVSVEVTDDETAYLVVAPSIVTIDEDGTRTFTLKLGTRPSERVTVTLRSDDTGAATVSPTSLTFNAATWDVAQTVTVRGVADEDAEDETVTVTATAWGVGYNGKKATVTVEVTDGETVGLVVAPSTVTITEGNTGILAIKLGTEPEGQVTVTLRSENAEKVAVLARRLTFTTSTWETWQRVVVRGLEDNDAEDEAVTVTAAATASSEDYDGKEVQVTVDVTDDETANLELSGTQITVDEEGTGTFTVALATEPPGTVTVTLESGDTGAVTVTPSTLTFTSSTWDTARTVTVRGAADDDTTDETVKVTATASGAGYNEKTAAVTVTVNDDDTVKLVVDPDALSINEDGTGMFTLKLSVAPTGTVTVTVGSDDTAAATVPAEDLTFTTDDWDTAQTVTVTGVTDANVETESVTVTATALGGGYSDVTATVTVEVTDGDGARGESADGSEATSAPAADASTDTAPRLAPAPVGLDVHIVLEGRDEIAIGWSEPSGNGPRVQGYESRIWLAQVDRWLTRSHGPSTRNRVFSVNPSHIPYRVQVRAITQDGAGQWSSEVPLRTDDCGSTTGDACTISVGTLKGNKRINTNPQDPDKDWFRVFLNQGTTYRIEVKGAETSDWGGTLADPYLELFDSHGETYAPRSDNDSGSGLNPSYVFRPGVSGIYYIQVSEHGDDATGTYTVSVVVAQ